MERADPGGAKAVAVPGESLRGRLGRESVPRLPFERPGQESKGTIACHGQTGTSVRKCSRRPGTAKAATRWEVDQKPLRIPSRALRALRQTLGLHGRCQGDTSRVADRPSSGGAEKMRWRLAGRRPGCLATSCATSSRRRFSVWPSNGFGSGWSREACGTQARGPRATRPPSQPPNLN